MKFSDERLVGSEWLDAGMSPDARESAKLPTFARDAATQVRQYFARKRIRFDVPLAFHGTELEIAIWESVSRIPFGIFVSYGEVARAVGRPGAHRAVARAMSTLEYALFVPAHRVIGADGRIKGADPNSMRVRLAEFERADYNNLLSRTAP